MNPPVVSMVEPVADRWWTIDDTGSGDDFEITASAPAPCTRARLQTVASSIGRAAEEPSTSHPLLGGGTDATNAARVLITQAEDSCGDVIGTVTAGTYTDAAAYSRFRGGMNWGQERTVPPIGTPSSDGPRVSAAGCYDEWKVPLGHSMGSRDRSKRPPMAPSL